MNLTKLWYQIKNWRAHWRALWLGRTVTVLDSGFNCRAIVTSNWKSRWRAFWRRSDKNAGGGVAYKGELSAKHIRADGRVTDLGVLSRRIVTTAGVNFMASDFADGASDINLFDFHASGTGVVAEAVGDTALGTDSAVARVSGTASNPTANQYRSVATMSYVSTLSITEHGLFSASTSGTLWDRSVFTAIPVVSGESIQFTYTLTITAGG